MVFFENSECLRCGAGLGFAAEELELLTLDERDPATGVLQVLGARDSVTYWRCTNASLAACNWLVRADRNDDTGDTAPRRCRCCELTRTVPDDDALASEAFAETEAAKRRLVFQLLELGLLETSADATSSEPQPIFDLLSSQHDEVTIGHDDGVITIDVEEADDAQRAKIRQQLGEPYRTMLGHFRHEIGHFYWPQLVEHDPGTLKSFRDLFGDERQSYADALDAHYGGEPPPDWPDRYVSAYATMHPWEDWAETFSHYLHIRDTLETALEHGLRLEGSAPSDDQPVGEFDALLADWLPLTYALNAVNRSLGRHDLYPVVLAPDVVEKLAFVHDLVA
jgi:hypothetical protein